MAEKRMFSKSVIDTDLFMDMPLSAQALYFHLSIQADDDGFISNPKRLQRTIGANDDDLRLLLLKRFLISFASGVMVVRHWKLHNTIRRDTYKETIYTEEKTLLESKETGEYESSLRDRNVPVTCPSRSCDEVSDYSLRDRNASVTQIRLDKTRLDKTRLDKEIDKEKRNQPKGFEKPTLKEIENYISEKGYKVSAENFFSFYESKGWLVGKTKMKSWQAALTGWNAREKGNSTANYSKSDTDSSFDINELDRLITHNQH